MDEKIFSDEEIVYEENILNKQGSLNSEDTTGTVNKKVNSDEEKTMSDEEYLQIQMMTTFPLITKYHDKRECGVLYGGWITVMVSS